MRKSLSVLVALSALALGACSSVDSQIHALDQQERELDAQIDKLVAARKANLALVTALRQLQRDGGTSKSKSTVAKMQADYETKLSKCD